MTFKTHLFWRSSLLGQQGLVFKKGLILEVIFLHWKLLYHINCTPFKYGTSWQNIESKQLAQPQATSYNPWDTSHEPVTELLVMAPFGHSAYYDNLWCSCIQNHKSKISVWGENWKFISHWKYAYFSKKHIFETKIMPEKTMTSGTQ